MKWRPSSLLQKVFSYGAESAYRQFVTMPISSMRSYLVLLRRSSAPSPSPHLVDTTWNIQSEDDSSSDSSSAESVHDLPLPGTLAGPQSGNDGGPFSASSAESPEALSEAIRAETERSSAFARVVEIAGILANHEDSTGGEYRASLT